jgi:7-cyano-7-deazaguanine synthase
MAKVLILFSGGADSLLMLKLAQRMGHEIAVVNFSYGQKHNAEVGYAEEQLKAAGIPNLYQMDLTPIFSRFKSNLLAGSDKTNYPGVHTAHVPARNTIFLGIAMGLAETDGYDEIWHGADYSDREHQFPDCYQEYFIRINEVAKIAGSRPVVIKAPLLGVTKDDVLAQLKADGVDLSRVYSGYTPPVSPAQK